MSVDTFHASDTELYIKSPGDDHWTSIGRVTGEVVQDDNRETREDLRAALAKATATITITGDLPPIRDGGMAFALMAFRANGHVGGWEWTLRQVRVLSVRRKTAIVQRAGWDTPEVVKLNRMFGYEETDDARRI